MFGSLFDRSIKYATFWEDISIPLPSAFSYHAHTFHEASLCRSPRKRRTCAEHLYR